MGENCPQSLWGLKVLFNLLFPNLLATTTNFLNENAMGQSDTPTPEPSPKNHARILHNGFFFTKSSTHLGNSLIQFYSKHNQASPVPGQIENIISRSGKFYFTVHQFLPIDEKTLDPFRFYPHLPIKLYSTQLSSLSEEVQVGPQVIGHIAKWNMTLHCAAIVSLSSVSVSSYNGFLSFDYLLRIDT
jgi:hypothetical protein